MEGVSLKFPILEQKGSTLLCVTKKDFLCFNLKASLGDNQYLLRRGSSPRRQIIWIVDREGCFRKIKILDIYRKPLKFLTFFHDFTLAKCEIEPGKQLPVGELLMRIDSAKSPPGFPTAGHLKGYLRKKPPDRIFDAVMFREFWDKFCPRLKPHEWEESI